MRGPRDLISADVVEDKSQPVKVRRKTTPKIADNQL